MQDDDAKTDSARSQKRETPEDADTAQEPERRVRPRETPVGAASAAAPEPEDEDEEASGKAESSNGDAVEDKDGEDGDTVATAPPAQPRTRVWYSVAQSNIGIGKPKSINYYFGRPDHLLKNSALARYAPDVTTVTRATAFYRAPRVSPAPGSPQRRA